MSLSTEQLSRLRHALQLSMVLGCGATPAELIAEDARTIRDILTDVIEVASPAPTAPAPDESLWCDLCDSYHPATEGVREVERRFECEECGESWEDTWCCDCDEDCPSCGTTCGSAEVISETVITEPVEAAEAA